MIHVAVYPECEELLRIASISRDQVSQSINERHRGMVTPGLDRIIAAHWFSDDRIVFVESVVTRKSVASDEDRVYFKEVSAVVALLLRAELPGGPIRRDMTMQEILGVVAASFGRPVTCHPDERPRTLYSGAWDGKRTHAPGGKGDVMVSGTFNREKSTAQFVWAFELNTYLEWLGAPTRDDLAGTEEEGSVVFTLTHPDKDWPGNIAVYDFGEVAAEGVVVQAKKNSDRTIELVVEGPLGGRNRFSSPIPECDERGLFVAITWKKPEVRFYLNGQLVDSREVS